MPDRPLIVLTQIALKPADPLPAHDVVRVDPFREPLLVGDMAADDDHGARLMLPDQPTHLPDLADVRHDGADPDHVVTVLRDLRRKTFQGGKIQQGAGGLQVVLDHHQSERAMKHPDRESTLDAGHLILIEFHRIDFSAAVLVIAGVGPEYAGQQDAGAFSKGMDRLMNRWHRILLKGM